MGDERDPLTRVRSTWSDEGPVDVDGAQGRHYLRRTHDGFLTAIVTREPHGLHLSIAHHNAPSRRTRARRYPSWDEIADARYGLCPPEIDMVMMLPAVGDYVAHHPTTFHLHQLDNIPDSALDRNR